MIFMRVLCIVKLETPQLKGERVKGDNVIKLADYSEPQVTPMCVFFGKTNYVQLVSKDGQVQGTITLTS